MVLGTGETAENTTNKNFGLMKLKFSLRGTTDGVKYRVCQMVLRMRKKIIDNKREEGVQEWGLQF